MVVVDCCVLDPEDGREEVQGMLDKEVSTISSTIDSAPQAQDKLLSELRDRDDQTHKSKILG